jgi:hypothetical protein
MPLQNRVTPFGEIVAIAQRGEMMGNRGIIHDPATRTLLQRRWASKAWLICFCDYKGRRRDVMATRSWTELFFLDEAVALAAGHRPCFFCRRDAALAFRAAWADAKGCRQPTAREMDDELHTERLDNGRKRIHPLPMALPDLPDGAVVVCANDAFMIAAGLAYRWTESGYEPPCKLRDSNGMLTPPSTLMALAGGYRPILKVGTAIR